MILISTEQLRIASAGNTPETLLDPAGYIRFKGRSMSPKTNEFSASVDEWIGQYIQEPAHVTIVDFHFEYLSTGNIKMYVHFLEKLMKAAVHGHKLVVNWFYEEDDIDIFEKGENLSLALGIQLNYYMTA